MVLLAALVVAAIFVIGWPLLHTAAPEDVDATVMDPKSIMMYPIPAKWTTNGASTGFNSDLSELDTKFIHKQYI